MIETESKVIEMVNRENTCRVIRFAPRLSHLKQFVQSELICGSLSVQTKVTEFALLDILELSLKQRQFPFRLFTGWENRGESSSGNAGNHC